jgi:hypothetical protein
MVPATGRMHGAFAWFARHEVRVTDLVLRSLTVLMSECCPP